MGDGLQNAEVGKERAGNGGRGGLEVDVGGCQENPGRAGGAEEAERECQHHGRYPALPAKQTGPEMPPGGCPRRGLCRPTALLGLTQGAAWQ